MIRVLLLESSRLRRAEAPNVDVGRRRKRLAKAVRLHRLMTGGRGSSAVPPSYRDKQTRWLPDTPGTYVLRRKRGPAAIRNWKARVRKRHEDLQTEDLRRQRLINIYKAYLTAAKRASAKKGDHKRHVFKARRAAALYGRHVPSTLKHKGPTRVTAATKKYSKLTRRLDAG